MSAAERLHRSRLFWRLTLGLWAASIAFLLFTAWTLSQIAAHNVPPTVAQRIDQMIAMNARTVLAIHRSQGSEASADMLRSMREDAGFTLYLYDAQSRPLWADMDDAEARRMLRGLIDHGEQALRPDPTGRGMLSRSRWIEWGGQRHGLVAYFEGPARPSVVSIIPDMWPVLFMAFLIAGMVSAFVAHWLLGPIRLLRRKASAFTAGDWQSRVGPALTARPDEFGDLGRDFDAMADHISALIENQRRLLRDISHELRSPLARVRIALALAHRPDHAESSLKIIERNADRLDALIGEILMLARLEHSEMQLHAEPFDLVQLADEVMEACQLEAQHRAQALIREGASALPVHADALLLQRAIENVVRNAVLHTPQGTCIRLHLTREGDDAVVEIRDEGPGVDAPTLERLFEPFYRGGEGHGEGSGLGLAIAKRAVELHDGDIVASTPRGGGLCIRLRLPVIWDGVL